MFQEDIIAEILLRLPVKSLVRFRCVSKLWHSLIIDPKFVKNHLNRVCECDSDNEECHGTHRSLILSNVERWTAPYTRCSALKLLGFNALRRGILKAQTLELPIEFDPCFYVVGHCDGLLLLQNYDEQQTLLWNPSIRDYKLLPNTQNYRPWSFYPVYGLGYDHSSNMYKVVKVVLTHDRRLSQPYNVVVEIFRLGKKSWTSSEILMPHLPNSSRPAIHLNGSVYWESISILGSFDGKFAEIVCFDLMVERFKEVIKPPSDVYEGCLGILQGSLCEPRFKTATIDGLEFWILKENGDAKLWTKFLTIGSIPQKSYPPYNQWAPLCSAQNCGVLIKSANMIFIYNQQGEIEHWWFFPMKAKISQLRWCTWRLLFHQMAYSEP